MFKLVWAILTDLFSLSEKSSRDNFEALAQGGSMKQAGLIGQAETIPVALAIEDDMRR